MKHYLLILLLALLFSCDNDEIEAPIAYIGIVKLTPESGSVLHEKTTVKCVVEYDIPEMMPENNGFVVFLNIRDKSTFDMAPAPMYPLPSRSGVFEINIPMGPDEVTHEAEFIFDVVLNCYGYGVYDWLASSKAYTYTFTPSTD
ncbi:hypothetical protein [Draconibacterium sp.]|uniref:hypothetical protein n=1 Tax=Draconibacterium sp. TaxID=1965318 RepID=UPI003569D5BC